MIDVRRRPSFPRTQGSSVDASNDAVSLACASELQVRLAERRTAPSRGRRQFERAAGFSLLEVLVAFVILALVATALFRLFSGALTNAGAADDYSRVALIAQSAVEEAALAPLREGTKEGAVDDGRVTWSARITPFTSPDVPPELETASETLPLRLWRIVVDVTFIGPNGAPRTITLATTRLGGKELQ